MVRCSPYSAWPGCEQLGSLVVLWGHKCYYPSISLIAIMCREYTCLFLMCGNPDWSHILLYQSLLLLSPMYCSWSYRSVLISVAADACVCHNYCVQLLLKGSIIFRRSPALNYSVCTTHKQRLVNQYLFAEAYSSMALQHQERNRNWELLAVKQDFFSPPKANWISSIKRQGTYKINANAMS